MSFLLFERILFPIFWKISSAISVFKDIVGNSMAKIYHLLSLLSVISKIFEKLANNKLADHLKKCKLFCYFKYVSGLLVQLQIFWESHMIKFSGCLIGLARLELYRLIYPPLSTGFDMLAFFTNSTFIEFQTGYFALFLHFSVTDGLDWFSWEVSARISI